MRRSSGSKPSADGDSTSNERAWSFVDAFAVLFAVVLVVVFGAVVIYGGTTPHQSPGPQATPGEPSLNSLLQESEGVPDVPKRHRKADIQNVTQVERLVASYVNAERVAYGSEAVVYNPELAEIARYHSYDMSQREYFKHNAPNGSSPGNRLKRYDYTECGYWAENIALTFYRKKVSSKPFGSWRIKSQERVAKDIFLTWMYSSSHRYALMHGHVDAIGIGIHVNQKNEVYATMLVCDNSEVDKWINGNETATIAVNQIVVGRTLNGEELPEYHNGFPPEDEPNDGDGSHTTPTTRERVA